MRKHAIVFAASLLVGCSDSTGPEDTNQFAEPLSISQFETGLATSARIEITFTSRTGLVAREIEVEPDDAEEKIVSRVTAIDRESGTVTLELGGLVVSYGGQTRFRTPNNSDAGGATWESVILTELDAGRNPTIEARRNPPATPQAPTVTAFSALDLRIADATDEAKIEVYVDADNFAEVSSPPPLALLTVFGFPIQIVSATRLERIVNDTPAPGANIEFEGRVTSVNVSAGRMTLSDGTVIQVSSTTVFDPEGDLLTLNAASLALLSAKIVRVEGDGTIQSAGPPRTIAATAVKIEVDD